MASSSSSSSSSYNSPCAACKFLRRKCVPGCIFAPYFPPEEPQKFVNVHKIFGASNVTKLLNDLLPHQRDDAVNSLAYEAEARVRDPVYGCVGAISFLQRQVHRLQKELDAANADLLRFASNELPPITASIPPAVSSITRYPVVNNPRQRPPIHNYHHINDQFSRSRIGGSEGEGFYQPLAAYSNNNPNYFLPWNVDNPSEDINQRGGGDDDVDNV